MRTTDQISKSKASILVIGKSRAGKSILIRAILGQIPITGSLDLPTSTKEVTLYPAKENEPFSLIDTIGFDHSSSKINKIFHNLKHLHKKENSDQISVIWFCIDGINTQSIDEELESLEKTTKFIKHVPVILVITKSVSGRNSSYLEKLQHAINENKHLKESIKAIIPVVALEYTIVSGLTIEPFGIDELVRKTSDLLPETKRLPASALTHFLLSRKKLYAHLIVASSVRSAITIGYSPIPYADGYRFSTMEQAEIKAIGLLYGIRRKPQNDHIYSIIIETGTVSSHVRRLITSAKAIENLPLSTDTLNGLLGGLIVSIIGQASIEIFEQLYLKKHSAEDIAWIEDILDQKFNIDLTSKLPKALSDLSISNKPNKNDLMAIIINITK